MADGARLGALVRHVIGIEVGAVRADPEPTLRAVATEARPLLVTTHAGLHVLSRGLAVRQEPVGLGIVERRPAATLSRDREGRVTVPAEGLPRVAGRTLGPRGGRLGSMPNHEIEGVETRLPDPVVTGETLLLGVTVAALRDPDGRRGPMAVEEGRRVAHRHHLRPRNRHPRRPSRTSRRQPARDRRTPDAVAGLAAIPGMTGGAGGHVAAGFLLMGDDPVLTLVAGRLRPCPRLAGDDRRDPGVLGEAHDDGYVFGIQVTPLARISRVANRAPGDVR